MPRKTIKITGEECDALYDQVRNHLAALGDEWAAASADGRAVTTSSGKLLAQLRALQTTAVCALLGR